MPGAADSNVLSNDVFCSKDDRLAEDSRGN